MVDHCLSKFVLGLQLDEGKYPVRMIHTPPLEFRVWTDAENVKFRQSSLIRLELVQRYSSALSIRVHRLI